MSFLELIGLVAAWATILGVFLTYYGIRNNKILKEESKGIRDILIKISEGQIKISEGQEETRREMAEAFKKMDNTLREIANLIVSESEKTRQAIKA